MKADDKFGNQLCKGIFWVKKKSNKTEIISLKIPVTCNGIISSDKDLHLNTKAGDNYNHRLTWQTLSSNETEGKPFDYFPRGRIEIRNGKAVVYANPNICTEEYMEIIVSMFCLDIAYGIQKVRIIPDYSEHYKCHMDTKNYVP